MARISTAQESTRTAWWRSPWSVLLPWALVVVLALSNIGTLVSGRLHSAGFNALEKVLVAISPSMAEHALSGSTTWKAKRQAELARAIALRSTGRLTTHALRSIASIPERVAPVVGTAAVVAFTVYDVKTDCATAADMNEILATLGQEQVDTGELCHLAESVPSPSQAWEVAKRSAAGVQRKAMDFIERMLGTPT